MKGKFYGIGIGPGDPELLTIKGAKILNSVDIVAIPESRREKGSLALEIVKGHLKEGAMTLTLTFPMIKDESQKREYRKKNAFLIKEKIDSGKNVAFLTLGDPMLYSTYIYLLEFLQEADIEIETVPGITSFCAISSRINVPLAKQNQNLGIISLDKTTDIEGLLDKMDNLVIMKTSSDNERLADILIKRKDSLDVYIASKAGTGEESISRKIEDLYDGIPYLTTVIIKKRSLVK